jgi:hypothetical protein
LKGAYTAMSSRDSGLTKKIALALILAVMLTGVLASAGLARTEDPHSVDFPERGHYFFGAAKFCEDQQPIPEGVLVTAQGAYSGWTGTATSAINSSGMYGQTTVLLVPTEDATLPPGNGAWPGDTIAFHILGKQASLYDTATGTTSTTYPFEVGGLTNLTLTICRPQYTITPTANAGGTITPSTPQTVLYGGSQTFTIATLISHNLVDVKVDGVSQGPITTYTFSNVTANHTIEAIFAIKTFTITPSANAGGTITPSTVQTVPYDGSQTFTIAPLVSHDLVDVKVDGVSKGPITTYTFSNVTANHTIEAVFQIKRFTLTPTAAPGTTITPSTAQIVDYGSNVTFTIAVAPSHNLVDVEVDGVSQGLITTYTFTNVTADHTIKTISQIKHFTITPTAGADGTITPATAQVVDYGSNVTFTMAGNTGYRVLEVKVDNVSHGPVTTYTFTNVTADHTITVSFTPDAYVISSLTSDPHCKITPALPQPVNAGANITFTITPDPGYFVKDVKVDSVSVGAVKTYPFTNVQADHTIEATCGTKLTFLPLVLR